MKDTILIDNSFRLYEINDSDTNSNFYINENKKCINYESGYIIKEND